MTSETPGPEIGPGSEVGPEPGPGSESRLGRHALGLLAWSLLFAWCLRPIWGIDIFSHVAIGRVILDTGIPQTDVLSAAHPEAPWSPFQVAYEVLYTGLLEMQVLPDLTE